jgi:hypothetical protein
LKGRSPWNKPSQRKADIYKLLTQVGGEARWKTLKAHLNELRLGPTTLKQALDDMVKEQSITKEARLGTEGAEVWYKIQNPLVNTVWKNLEQKINEGCDQNKPDALLQMFEDIKANASKLKGKEKENYLKTQMEHIVKAASEAYVAFLSLHVRGAQFADSKKLSQIFDYLWSDLLLNDTKTFQKILGEYPTIGLRAIESFLIRDKAKLEDLLASEEEYRKAMIAELKNPK